MIGIVALSCHGGLTSARSLTLQFGLSFLKHVEELTNPSRGALAEFPPEAGARADAALEIFERETFVRAVQVVGVLAPAEEQRVDAENLLEGPHDRD